MAGKKRGDGAGTPAVRGEGTGGRVELCADGKYRWTCEVSLYKDLSIFLLVWKILFFVTLGISALIVVADLISWGTADLAGNLKFLLCFTAGMTLLTAAGYLLYAVIMGGKYRVLFEMDAKGVTHRQIAEQAEKARAISALTVLAGLLSRRPTTVGAGLNSARTEMYSDFSRVREVKACPSSHLIKVNGRFSHNRVYAAPEDFEFVLGWITSHCPGLKK